MCIVGAATAGELAPGSCEATSGTVAPFVPRLAATLFSASRNSSADWNRCAGSFDSAFRMIWFSDSGKFELSSTGGRGGCCHGIKVGTSSRDRLDSIRSERVGAHVDAIETGAGKLRC